MSGNEIQLVVGEMREGFKQVREDIKQSRVESMGAIELNRRERNDQIDEIHARITDIKVQVTSLQASALSSGIVANGMKVRMDEVAKQNDANTKLDTDYPRKDQKEVDLGFGKLLTGKFTNIKTRDICEILIVLGVVVTMSYMAISKYRELNPSKVVTIEKTK